MDRPTCKTCPHWGTLQIWDGQVFRGSFEEEVEFEQLIEHECRGGFPTVEQPKRGSDRRYNEGIWPRTYAFEHCGQHPDFPAYLESLKATGAA